MKITKKRPWQGAGVEQLYFYFAAGVVILFLLAAAVIALCARGGRMCAGSAEEQPVFLSHGKIETLEFSEECCYIAAGDRLMLRVSTQPETHGETITWSSSNAAVARVDANGVVTAVADGSATITAAAEGCSDTIVIAVADDILVAASDCLRQLADGCSDGAIEAARIMTDKLDRSDAKGAQYASKLIDIIISYTEKADRAALDKAIRTAGMDPYLCRRAAASCWAYGELQRSGAVISFTGDCTLGRYNESEEQGRFPSVYRASGSLTYPFDRTGGIFAADSLTVINFEGTLTDSVKHRDKTFFFRGDPALAEMLPASSIECAVVANNHSSDYLEKGYEDTVSHLDRSGVAAVEHGVTRYIRVGQFETAMIAASCVGTGFTEEISNMLLDRIAESKERGALAVVNLHWGEEGSATPAQWQRDAAHRLIDGGADLIIGHHPHVAQGIEMYNGKYIAYSLGNFAFGGNRTVNSPLTLILRARISAAPDGTPQVTGISMLPCRTTSSGTRVNNYQPMLCFGTDGDGVYNELLSRCAAIDGVTAIDRPDV